MRLCEIRLKRRKKTLQVYISIGCFFRFHNFIPVEFASMPLEMLRDYVPVLQDQLDKTMRERNYMQLERDAIKQFAEITERETEEFSMMIRGKEREMEEMEENHRVEIQVYAQRVKHLEFEHQNRLREVEEEEKDELEEVVCFVFFVF